MSLDIQSQAEDIEVPEEAPSETMEAVAHTMRENKDACEALEDKVKELKREYAALQEQLFDKMLEDGLQKIAFDFGSFTSVLKQQCSINPDRQEQAFAALEAHGLGASIKRMIHYQTLNKHYRDGDLVIENESAAFKTWTTKTIAMRRKN